MTCLSCGGNTKIAATVHNPPENEMFRKRECLVCGCGFFTIEFAIEETESFTEEWDELNRARLKSYRK